MQLALDSISKKVGAQTWLYDMSLQLHSGAVTVLPSTGNDLLRFRDADGFVVELRGV